MFACFLQETCGFSEFLVMTCLCFSSIFFSVFLQILREMNSRPNRAKTYSCRHQWTLRPVPSPTFHSTTLYSYLQVQPNHTLPPHIRTLPPVPQVLTPDLTSTHHTSIPLHFHPGACGARLAREAQTRHPLCNTFSQCNHLL